MYEYRAEVVAVVDGDTLDLVIDLGLRVSVRERVRLYGPDPAGKLGLDAPELRTPEGRAARDWLAKFFAANGTAVTVRTVKDQTEKYGRWLAVVYAGPDGANVNQLLLDNGAAALREF